MTSALLLINLGTPGTPRPPDVASYLREFLMDPLVVDVNWLVRFFLVNVIIVPRRAHLSAKLYEKVWTDRGSPLSFHSLDLKSVVQRNNPKWRVELSMRYGAPSIRNALSRLKKHGVSKLTVMPLYPQYSLAATESSIQKVKKELKDLSFNPELNWIKPFYNHPKYLEAVAELSAPHLASFAWDKVLFSFHGLPVRQVLKTDPSNTHCFSTGNCCDKPVAANTDCYRFQCYETARQLAKRLGLPDEKYVVGFQSRLGRTPWIKPYSDELYESLAKSGVKRLAVLCPSFVADCLETLEEVEIRGAEQFKKAGGEALKLIPSLNSSPGWAEAISQIAGLG